MLGIAKGDRAPPARVVSEGPFERSWRITAFPCQGSVRPCLVVSECASAQSFAKPGELIIRKGCKTHRPSI